jgi:DNA-directed RNA polymerase specialized sigma subunit
MTQAECARLLGVSRARVSQIEARALSKLRKGLWAWSPERQRA